MIVMVIGISFLGTKFVSENRTQKREILGQVVNILAWMKKDEFFYKKYARQKIIEEVKKFRPWEMRQAKNLWPKLSFFVLDKDNNLIFKELLEEVEFEEIDFEAKKIYKDSGTYIVVQEIETQKIIFYQNIRYSFDDLWRDILLLFILASILSLWVYFIGLRFVEKALGPVEENLQDMTDFIHNAGHELKTPLAVMRGNLQVMQAEKKLDKNLVKLSIWEIDTMNWLIESLRELSELGSLSAKEPLSFIWEIENIQREFHDMLLEKNIEFLSLTSEHPKVLANKYELHLMLSNIIKNAIKYTPKWWKIEITYEKNRLSISDNWVGISTVDQEKIFDRFFQWENARSKDGFGIGLSLVKKIADTNGWKVDVKSKKWKWTTVQIVF